MSFEKAREAVTRVVDPFFKQGDGWVFVALCCDRVYVSPVEAKLCRTCKATPTNYKLRSIKDIDSPSEAFSAVLSQIEAKSQFGDPAK
jgi:hypothetical protein